MAAPEAPESFLCPITSEVMSDPVSAKAIFQDRHSAGRGPGSLRGISSRTRLRGLRPVATARAEGTGRYSFRVRMDGLPFLTTVLGLVGLHLAPTISLSGTNGTCIVMMHQ